MSSVPLKDEIQRFEQYGVGCGATRALKYVPDLAGMRAER